MSRTWNEWLASWDAQQTWHLPDREERLGVLVATVEAVVGRQPRVLDLACGPGSITARLLERLPETRTVGVDVDPVLLTIASGVLGADPRVTLVRADLRDPEWLAALPPGPFDAAVTATALHWLPEDVLRRVYRDMATLLRAGGVFANADHMPVPGRLGTVADAATQHAPPDGAVDWERWWQEVEADSRLAPLVAQRRAIFTRPHTEFTAPTEWHVQVLTAAGFAEAAVVWRRGSDAVVAAVR